MSRQSLLAAAAIGVAGLALGAAVVPAQAATSSTPSPSIHVVAPCEGDAGTIAFTAGKAGTGMSVHGTLAGLTHTQWYGGVYVGTPPVNAIINSIVDGDPVPYTAVNGKVSASTTSTKAWPHLAAGIFFNKTLSSICVAAGAATPTRVEAAALQTDLVVRRDTKVVRVQGEDLAAGTWRVVVKLTSPAGLQRQAKTVTIAKGGTYSTSFRGFKKVGVFTRAVVVATSHNGKHTTSLTVARTA